MHTVKERSVRSHFGRKRVKEAGCFQQHIHALIDIANEDHRSGCGFFFLSTGKGTGRHIVLHDLDAVLVLEVDTGNLVKRHAVPQTDQANGFSAHVVKQVRNGSLTAGNKDAVRGDFFVDMGFTSASRTEFTEVEVVLDKRQHTGKQKPAFAVVQLIRLITAGAQHDLKPLFFGEVLSAFLQFLDVHMGHLDRRQLTNVDGRSVFLFFQKLIFELYDAPDTAAKQPVKLRGIVL